MDMNHTPVLLEEIQNAFKDTTLKLFVDGTLGAGGHAEAILSKHPEIERFIGIDQDPIALDIAKKRLKPWHEKITYVHGSFSDLKEILHTEHIESVDGLLFDIGVSSMQFSNPDRGFSFQGEGPLDMRMDPTGSLTAEEIVNHWSEQKLGEIFKLYGEERRWRQAAKRIVEERRKKPIVKAKDLERLFHWPRSPKGKHPLTRLFQALRIAVNFELERLESLLPQAFDVLNPKGRLAIISFHSLEDRKVKFFFKGLGEKKIAKVITKKPLQATLEERRSNPRSRSAKLRILEK